MPCQWLRYHCRALVARLLSGLGLEGAPGAERTRPTWPPTSSHYIPCTFIIDSAVPESTSIICPGDSRHPFCNKVLKHVQCWNLPPTKCCTSVIMLLWHHGPTKKNQSHQAKYLFPPTSFMINPQRNSNGIHNICSEHMACFERMFVCPAKIIPQLEASLT